MSSAYLTPSRFFREAFQAVTEFSFYRTIFQQRLSRTFLFFVYLVFTAAAVQTVAYGWTAFPAIGKFLGWMETNFPPLRFDGAALSVQGQQPLVLKYLSKEVHTFVIDTSGNPESPYKFDQPVYLLTRDNLMVLRGGQRQTWPWEMARRGLAIFLGPPDGVRAIDHRDWAEWRRLLPWVFFPGLFAGLLLEESSIRLLQALLLTFFGMSASVRLGVRLPFSHYFNISLYSLTPAVAINLIVAATGQYVFYFDLIYLATAAIYTYKATQKVVVIE